MSSAVFIPHDVHNAQHFVKAKRTPLRVHNARMIASDEIRPDEAQRLVEARKARGFADAKAAAEFFGWNYDTYIQHERGERGLSRAAARYAKAFRVSPGWLRHAEGVGLPRDLPIVGWVGAGSVYAPFEQHEVERIPAPEWANDKTVAAIVRGESLGPLFDQWLVYYDQVKEQPTSDMMNKLCVIGLTDDRIVVKRIKRGQIEGYYNLFSNTESPMYDAEIGWCAIVRHMSPR